MDIMSDFAHIIAKHHLGRWSAWFEDTPYILSEADGVSDAICALMKLHDLSDLSTDKVVTVDGGTVDGRLETRVRATHR